MPKILEAAGESFSAEQIVEGCSPVPSELKSTSWFAVVGEAPGKDELKLSRPMVGRSGMRLTESLASLGLPRHNFDVLNVLSCHPPGDKLNELLKLCKKRGWSSPVECCRPRLNAELAKHDKVIAVGGLAARALLKIPRGILTVRGSPVTIERGFMESSGSVEVEERYDPETGELVESADTSTMAQRFSALGGYVKILPTVHPAFVLRANRWAPIFLSDLGRAVRFFQDRLNWVDPLIYVQPTADALYTWLNGGAGPQSYWAFDTETEWGDPLTVDLRTVQIGIANMAVVIPFYSIEEEKFGQRFYDAVEENRIKDVLRWFFQSSTHIKTGHNANVFDRQVLERHLGVKPHPVVDGLIVHRLVNPEIPHALGVVGSIYTDARAWKANEKGEALSEHARSDTELHKYGGTDAVISYQILPPMLVEAAKRCNEVAQAFGYKESDRRGLDTRCPGLPD
jgi:uracil-DNA glycosylase family 4